MLYHWVLLKIIWNHEYMRHLQLMSYHYFIYNLFKTPNSKKSVNTKWNVNVMSIFLIHLYYYYYGTPLHTSQSNRVSTCGLALTHLLRLCICSANISSHYSLLQYSIFKPRPVGRSHRLQIIRQNTIFIVLTPTPF